MKILIVTTEPIPLPGYVTTGAGIRAWALAQGLRAKGLTVSVAMAADSVQRPITEHHEGVTISAFAREHLTKHVRALNPDALVMQHWGLMNRLGRVDCPLAIDLAGPHLLERLYWGTPSPEQDIEEKLDALRRADFLTCSGEFQRKYFLGFAAQSGFDMSDPRLLPVIPYSVSPDLPEERDPRAHDPAAFVYSGMLLPWQDPQTGVRALLQTLQSKNKGRLRFIGGAHPTHDVSKGAFDALLSEINASPQATIEPTRPYSDLLNDLAGCGVALDLMARNPERELAFTSRTVVYMACGLPVIHDDYSELSQLIAEYDAGWCLDPSDAQGVAELTARILDHPEEVERRRANARRLVSDCLTWDRTIAPLAAWLANPVALAKRPGFHGMAERLTETRRRLEQLEVEHAALRGRRLVKLSDYLRRIRLRRG